MTTVPTTPQDLEEYLADPAKMTALFKDGRPTADFSAFVKNYAQTLVNKDEAIATQVKEETQRVLAEYLKENRPVDRLDLRHKEDGSPVLGGVKNAIYNPKAPGAAIDKEFDGAADFFKAIWHNTTNNGINVENQARLTRIKNAMSSVVPSDGGFLIPETLRSELLRVALETSVVRSRARVIPMETLRVPFPAIDSTSNVGSVYGGISGYWTEEGANLTNSQPSFGRVVLEAKKLTAYTEAPNELLSDSAQSFEAFINQIFPEALSFYEDDAFTSGTGVGQPLGYLNADAAVSVAKETGQAAATIVWENIVKMYSRMLPGSLDRAVWVCSIDTFPELATMALSVGTAGSAIWLNNGASGAPMTILGRPVIFTEKTSVLGTAGDINFVDFGYYLIGDRQTMQATSSPHFKFQSDVTAFKIVERVDGRPWLNSAITPKNGSSNTLSPFVKIATRS